MENRIMAEINAALYTLEQIMAAAQDGKYLENAGNIVRECRNVQNTVNQLWADWLTAAAAQIRAEEENA